MNSLIRTAFVALVGGLLTLGIFGLHFACTPSDYQRFLRESRRHEEILRVREATLDRMEARRQAVEDWIAQRRTLAEIMKRFQELDQEWFNQGPIARKRWTGSDEERQYQYILFLVNAVLQERPGELAAVLRRLEKDYQQFQADKQKPSTEVSAQKEKIIERGKKGGR